MADEPQVTTGSEPVHVEPVFVPEQVRRAAERADELSRQLAAERDGDEGQPPGATPPAPRPEGREPPPPAPEPPAASTSTDTSFEQRYRTLQGKYDSEIPALRAQVSSLERLIGSMQTPATPQVPQAPAGGPIRFEESDVDIYGQDFLEAAARAAAARYEPVIADLRSEIHRLRGGQETIQSQTTQDKVFAELDKDPELVGWQQLNTNPAFIQWLQGLDEYAGVPRNQMLQHAYSNGDAIRTGRFFKKYMAEHTVPPPPPPAQTGRAPRPNGNGHAAPAGTRLEDMVVPGRAAGPGPAGSSGAPSPRIWSRPEITRFYRDRTEGRFRGREGESDALERDILAAAQEGRIH